MPRESTLKEHARKGKKLIPPLLRIPKMHPRSWIDDALPDMLWATLLISHLKRENALEIFRQVVKKLAEYAKEKESVDINFNVTHSGLSNLPESQLTAVIEIMCSNPAAKAALIPLLLYKKLPAYAVWHKALGSQPSKADWEKLAKAINVTLFHQSQEATDCRWVKLLFVIVSGKLQFTTKTGHIVDEVLGYPNVGDMRKVRASIRAGEIGLSFPPFEIKNNWPKTFWQESLKHTLCFASEEKKGTPDNKPDEKMVKKINEWFYELLNMFGERLTTSKTDAKKDSVFGLAFYSWRLVVEIILNRTSELLTGRLALRTLLECYIVLAYLAKEDDKKLWQTYRSYGTGQAKLAQLKFDEMDEYPSFISKEELYALANEDAWVEFVPIDLGHWGGLNLRDISIKVGAKKMYDKYYIFPSSFGHGQWTAVRHTVFQTCGNPLHRLHRIPLLYEKLLPDLSADALEIFNKILSLVEEVYPSKRKK